MAGADVGDVRSDVDLPEDFDIITGAARRDGVIIVPAERIVRDGVDAALAGVPGGGAAYVTVGIDVLDPAGAPGTGYPEPGGINYYQLKGALQIVASRYELVGIDLAEVDPIYDAAGVTPRIAAKLLLDLLGAVFRRRGS
jgi:agmatinase